MVRLRSAAFTISDCSLTYSLWAQSSESAYPPSTDFASTAIYEPATRLVITCLSQRVIARYPVSFIGVFRCLSLSFALRLSSCADEPLVCANIGYPMASLARIIGSSGALGHPLIEFCHTPLPNAGDTLGTRKLAAQLAAALENRECATTISF